MAAAGLVAAVLLFWPPALDSFGLAKVLVLVVAAGTLLALHVGRALATGTVELPRLSVTYTALAVLAAVWVTTATSDAPLLSFVGTYSRYDGAALYTACIVIFLVATTVYDEPALRAFAWVLAGTLGAVALYTGLETLGLDVGQFDRTVFTVLSTLGNPNATAGFVGIVIPLAAALALLPRVPRRLRAGAGVVATAGFLVALLTRSALGPVAAAAGLGVVALAWIRTRKGRTRSVGTAAVLAAGGAGVATMVAGFTGALPLPGFGPQAVGFRLDFWSAAVRMTAENPLLGVGLDRYGVWYRVHRPLRAALREQLSLQATNPHNVPLSMFANGGLLLGLCYVAFVLVTLWLVIRGLRRLEGDRLLLLGGFAGCWAAYQTQSLVSIDYPPVAALHWIAAAGVVVLVVPSADRRRTVEIPWLRVGNLRRRQLPTAARMVALGSVLVLGILVSGVLRADIAVRRGMGLAERGVAGDADAMFEQAVGLAGWQPHYWLERGRAAQNLGDPAGAMQAFESAAARDPRSFSAALGAARAAQTSGRENEAERWYRRALELEPVHPALKAEVGSFAGSVGDAERASELLSAAVDARPRQGEWWRMLGQARQLGGDLAGARSAYEEALELDPSDSRARALLDEITP